MHTLRWMILILVLGGLALGSTSASADLPPYPMGTAFSYQGYLKIDGAPANGQYDLLFQLYEDDAGASPVGTATEFLEIPVTDGLFSVLLDFGAQFDGSARWLKISVRPSGSGNPYTALSPLRQITPVPYALFAQQAGLMAWSGLTGMPSGFADGVDNDTLFTNGTGLTLNGTDFSIHPSFRLPQSCDGGQTAKWSGSAWQCGYDNNTLYSAGPGLTLSETDFSILVSYRLPQFCTGGQVTKWNSSYSQWVCGDDQNSTYSAGLGLEPVGSAFQIAASFRLPQTCSNGQVIKWNSGTSLWECANDIDVPYTAGKGIDITGHTVSAEGTPYQNVVIVAKSGGDNTSINSAVGSINDASADNPYLVWVAPGVYNERVTMKPYVDIQGAGQNVTTIYSGGSNDALNGVVRGADHSALRDLSILSDVATGGGTYPIGLYLDAASTTVQNVSITSQNGIPIGLSIRFSSPRMENINVTCTATDSIGIYCVHIQNSKPVIRDLTISARNTGFSELYGIYNTWNSQTQIDGLKITLSGSGGTESAGIRNRDDVADTNPTTLEARHVQIENNVSASSYADMGVWNMGQDALVRLEDGTITVFFGTQSCRGVQAETGTINHLDDMDIEVECSMGNSNHSALYLYNAGATVRGGTLDGWANEGVVMENATLDARGTQISGGANTIYTVGTFSIRLADVQLDGGDRYHHDAGSIICANVYDENFTVLGANVCPP